MNINYCLLTRPRKELPRTLRRLGHLLGPQRREVVDHLRHQRREARVEHACPFRDVYTVRQRPVQEDGLHLRRHVALRHGSLRGGRLKKINETLVTGHCTKISRGHTHVRTKTNGKSPLRTLHNYSTLLAWHHHACAEHGGDPRRQRNANFNPFLSFFSIETTIKIPIFMFFSV